MTRFSRPTRLNLLLLNFIYNNYKEINFEKREMGDFFQPKVQDMLKPQIHDNCRLAMPEGLQDLMSDISREVLRAQPKNLLQFITNYLSALLVTRENLTTAVAVCDDVCDNMCAAGLEDELRYRGIDADDIKVIKEIVNKYLVQTGSGKSVKEGYLISKIMRKTSVSADKILDIKEAVRTAFLRQQAYNTTIYELTPDDSMDSITRATQHTLDLYRKTKPSDEEYRRAVQKIEAAYKAYGVRRQKAIEASRAADWFYSPDVLDRAEVESINEVDQVAAQCKHISFLPSDGYAADTESHFADTNSVATNVSEKTDEIYTQYVHPIARIATVSSYSLPGSFMHLPKYKPYNVGDEPISEIDEKEHQEDEEDEKQKEEHFNVDYTREASLTVNELPDVIFDAEPDDVETDSSIEEEVQDLKKVVIDSAVEILSDGRIDEDDDDEDEVDEQIHQLAVDIEKSRFVQ